MPNLQKNRAALEGRIFNDLYRLLKNQPRLANIERLADSSSPDFVNRFVVPGYPVILRGLLSQTAKSPKGLLGALREDGNGTVIEARYGNYADPVEYRERRKLKEMMLSSYIDLFSSGEIKKDLMYVGNAPMPNGAISDLGIGFPESYPLSEFQMPRMWLGPAGAITPLHKDIADNFCFHIFGVKRWIIFPVRDFEFLYMTHPDPDKLPDFATSSVDLRHPDIEKFPLFQNASALSALIYPGETLYLPAGWSHYVETIEDSLMVNFWLKRHRSPGAIEMLLHGAG